MDRNSTWRLAAISAAAIAFAGCEQGPPIPTEPPIDETPHPAPEYAVAATSMVNATWYRDPGGVALAVDQADQVYTARWDYNPAGDIYLAKRGPTGNLLWEVRYDNTDNTRHEVATWVGVDRLGNALVSGTIRSGYSSPVNANSLLMKFAPDGRLLWRRVYANPFDGSSTRQLLVDQADNIYVLGLGMSPNGLRTTVRKFAPDGTTPWVWFDPVGVGGPVRFKLTPDGALVIAARASTGSSNGFAKISAAGTTIWTLAGPNSISGGDIAGDAFGNAYLINGDYPAGTGSRLRKIGPTAATIWERTHPITGTRVEVGFDHAPVVSGTPAVGYGAAFTKFDPNGNLLWTNLDADGPNVALLSHGRMILDPAGNAYLAASNMSQMGVTKVTSTGASAWTALIPFGYAVDLGLGTSQQVYVVGGTLARIDQTVGPAPTNADLGVTLTDSPDPVRNRRLVTVTATVGNAGPAAATNVAFTVTLPSSFAIQSVVPSAGLACAGTAPVRCTAASLGIGASRSVVITARPQAVGTFTSSASVAATETDPVTGNNTARQTTRVVRP